MKSVFKNEVENGAVKVMLKAMATKSEKSGKKPSPAQLAARKNFAKMAKERAAAARKGGGKKSNIGKSSKGKRAKLGADFEQPRKPFQSSLRSFKLKKARPLKARASRQYVSGPPSMQDDVSKVSMRGPRLQLEALDESKFEIDLNGSFSKMGF